MKSGGWSKTPDPTPTLKHILRTIMQVVAGGIVRGGDKQDWGDSQSGFWLGVDAQNTPRFDVGDTNSYFRWSPNRGAELAGSITLSGPQHQITTGGGDARMDADGFSVRAGTNTVNQYKIEADEIVITEIYGDVDTGATTLTHLTARGKDPTTPEATITITAITHNGTPAAGTASVSITLATENGHAYISPHLQTPTLEGLQVNPSSAAIPLRLKHANPNAPLARAEGTSATNTSTLVDAADYPTPGTIRAWLKIYIKDNAGTGPIPEGAYYVPLYTTPA